MIESNSFMLGLLVALLAFIAFRSLYKLYRAEKYIDALERELQMMSAFLASKGLIEKFCRKNGEPEDKNE